VTGGFTPVPPHLWTVDRRARTLGFAGLRAYLDACYTHACHSLPQLANELGTSVWMVRAAMDAHCVVRLPGPEAKGRARQAASDRLAAARAAALGFPDIGAYLLDRYAERARPLPQLAGELGTGTRVVGRLLREHGVIRSQATAAQAAAGARARAAQAARHTAWRQARLAALGGLGSWPATCGCARSSRAGRSRGSGPSWARDAAGYEHNSTPSDSHRVGSQGEMGAQFAMRRQPTGSNRAPLQGHRHLSKLPAQ